MPGDALRHLITHNSAGIANAGQDQAIHAGNTVMLNGLASFDDNTATNALVYAWKFDSKPTGSSAVLANTNTATPQFFADKAVLYVAQLAVTDEEGLASTADTVEVSTANLAPTALATADPPLAIIGSAVILNGSGSRDPEGNPLTYQWDITGAPLAVTLCS